MNQKLCRVLHVLIHLARFLQYPNTTMRTNSCSMFGFSKELGQMIVISKLCSHYFHRERMSLGMAGKEIFVPVLSSTNVDSNTIR